MSNPNAVALGDQTYTLFPQRIGRINRKLAAVTGLFSQAAQGDVPTEVGPQLHEALQVFIPDLAPLWKLAGYASAEAYQALVDHREALAKAQDAYGEEHHGQPWSALTPEQKAGFDAPAFDDPYDEAADRSPTPPEIVHAVEVIFDIHGGTRLVRLLKNVVTPEMIRGAILRMQAEAVYRRSQALHSPNGASTSTPSTTSAPTSTPSEASPPSDSLTSLAPTETESASAIS